MATARTMTATVQSDRTYSVSNRVFFYLMLLDSRPQRLKKLFLFSESLD